MRILSHAKLGVMALFLTVSANGAHAQSSTLLAPLPQNQLRDATPAQTGYLRVLQDKKTTGSLQLVQVDIGALGAKTVAIPLADGRVLQVDGVRKTTRSASDFSWFGTLPNGGNAMLVVQNGDITGSVRDGTDLYQIMPVSGGVHALIAVDQSKVPPEHPPGALPEAPRGASPDRQGLDRQGDASSTATQGEAAADSVRVDVLVPYTNAVAAAVSNIGALIQLAVDESNQAYAQSNAGVVLRLVGTMQVNYTEYAGTSDPFSNALNDVTNGTGVMAAVHTRRDALGADEVALLISDSTYCGLGWLNSTENLGYVAVAYNCATGYYSFAHEIGHNFGARHDPQVDATTTPYAYAHGFHNGNAWRTIMAYGDYCGNCPRLQYFSNPSVLYQGVAMGTSATSDNARVHRERVATIASFRPDATSPLYAATLPSSRSIQVGSTATAFATIVNTGVAATGCGIVPITSTPATFTFQTTNSSTNALSGSANTRVPIAANGSQSYVVAYAATGTMTTTDVRMDYGCSGVTSAIPIVGVNTLKLTYSSSPVPDMIAVGLTASNDGYSHLTGSGQTGVFVISTANIGVAGTLTARAVAFNGSIPVTTLVCETTPSTGVCKNPPSATVTRVVNQNDTATWTAFITATAAVAPDPAVNRVSFEFVDSGSVVRGSTSIAVTTSP